MEKKTEFFCQPSSWNIRRSVPFSGKRDSAPETIEREQHRCLVTPLDFSWSWAGGFPQCKKLYTAHYNAFFPRDPMISSYSAVRKARKRRHQENLTRRKAAIVPFEFMHKEQASIWEDKNWSWEAFNVSKPTWSESMLAPISPLSSLSLCMLSTRIPRMKSSRVVVLLQWSTLWDKAKTLEAICQSLSQWNRLEQTWSLVQGEVLAAMGPGHLARLLWCNADQPQGSKALQAQGR